MAGLTTTQSFSDGDTVTAAKLNNIVGNASIDDDAITTVKINDGDVTLAKMAALSVDTGQLVADSVQNAKLDNMAASTVKANATSGSANPTDVAVAANKLLVGTSDSINAVSFTTDLELDAADSAAADIQVADTLISGKSTVTVVPANDTVLVYDADGSGNKLGKATVTDMMQTLPAVTTTSGVVRLATAERSVDSTVAGTVDADVLTAKLAGPMLAKAWGYLITSSSAIFAGSFLQNCTVSRTGTGAFTVLFDPTDVPSVKYMVMGNGRSGAYAYGLQVVSSSLATTGFTFVTVDTNDSTRAARDPDGGVQFVVYGLTS